MHINPFRTEELNIKIPSTRKTLFPFHKEGNVWTLFSSCCGLRPNLQLFIMTKLKTNSSKSIDSSNTIIKPFSRIKSPSVVKSCLITEHFKQPIGCSSTCDGTATSAGTGINTDATSTTGSYSAMSQHNIRPNAQLGIYSPTAMRRKYKLSQKREIVKQYKAACHKQRFVDKLNKINGYISITCPLISRWIKRINNPCQLEFTTVLFPLVFLFVLIYTYPIYC